MVLSKTDGQVSENDHVRPKWAFIDGNGHENASRYPDFRDMMALLVRLVSYNKDWARVDDRGIHIVPFRLGKASGLADPLRAYVWVRGDSSPSPRAWMNLFGKIMDIAEAERDELISLRTEVARLRAERDAK